MAATSDNALRRETRPPAAKVLHSAVPGRMRLEVPGLRRRPAVKAALERDLIGRPGIRRASASVWSGNVVVHFDPEMLPDAVIDAVGDCVAAARRRAAAGIPPPPSAPPTPSRQAAGGNGAPPAEAAWHALPAADVLARVGGDAARGLTADEAERRLRRFGPNVFGAIRRRSRLIIFAEQFNSLPVLLLAASSALSLVSGGVADALMIAVVLAVNGTIGYVTEREAERTISALDRLVEPAARVLRDGRIVEIAADAVVVGDTLVLAPGTIAAADARVLEARELTIDESTLTGESMPVAKSAPAMARTRLPLAERLNIVYRGTAVTGGNGTAVVVAAGAGTEIARIQALVETEHAPETPLHAELGRMGRTMAWGSSAVCLGIFAIGLLRGTGAVAMLRSAASLAVAAVPEGLPMVATTTLAIGVRRMRAKKVLVRHLAAIETLGEVQTICLDKTGTLTLNRMSAACIALGDGRTCTVHEGRVCLPDGGAEDGITPGTALADLLQIAALCNDTRLVESEGGVSLRGSPTETALTELALASGIDVTALQRAYPRLTVNHRTEDRKYMTSLHDGPGGGRRLVAVKGSPDEVLAMCRYRLGDDGIRPLTRAARSAIEAQNLEMAGSALRVLGFARSESGHGADAAADPLTWLGLIGMADPPRAGLSQLMGTFHDAGIDTVMLTGDQSATAFAIARELGLSRSGTIEILDSEHLENLDADMLSALARRTNVFARISPSHKLAIVRALQRQRRVVAMTGDGINDSPALKAADIGIAMGQSGTDVAREVADLVIENDDLHTLATAVREGRTIYANIRKSLRYLLSTNFSEIAVSLTAVAAGLGQPLTPMQLLWINLLSDVLPGLALALDPAEQDVMLEPPRAAGEPIIGGRDLRAMAVEGTVIATGSLGAYLYGRRRYGASPAAGTMAFSSLIIAQLLHALSCRTPGSSMLSRRRQPPNHYLNGAVAGSLAAQAALTLIPPLGRALGVAPLDARGWVVTAAAGVLPLLAIETAKALPTPGLRVTPDSATQEPQVRQ